jgi:hypothetical protein
MTDAEMPWRKGENGDVIINWDYENGDGVTLRERKRQWTAELVEDHDETWVAESQQRLDEEFEMIVTMGLLT